MGIKKTQRSRSMILKNKTTRCCLKTTNMQLMQMMEAVLNFKMEFHKDIEILKMTGKEVKMELKTPISQLEKSRKCLTNSMNQAEDINIKT